MKNSILSIVVLFGLSAFSLPAHAQVAQTTGSSQAQIINGANPRPKIINGANPRPQTSSALPTWVQTLLTAFHLL